MEFFAQEKCLNGVKLSTYGELIGFADVCHIKRFLIFCTFLNFAMSKLQNKSDALTSIGNDHWKKISSASLCNIFACEILWDNRFSRRKCIVKLAICKYLIYSNHKMFEPCPAIRVVLKAFIAKI